MSCSKNSCNGVALAAGAGYLTDGTTVASQPNVVSGNVVSGSQGHGIALLTGATGTVVAGNYIGTDAGGTKALGNAGQGVYIYGAGGNTIGGTTAGARNVISGNGGNGVDVEGSGATGNLIEGNYIGTDATGTAPLGNGAGIRMDTGSANNTIGGTTAAARNLIGGNGTNGVTLQNPGVTHNQLLGNFIGTDASGTNLTLAGPRDLDGIRELTQKGADR